MFVINLRGNIPDSFFNYNRRSDILPGILPENAFLLDTHSHTTASDDGWMSPEQCVRWHIANGFNAFVLTDHNTGKNNEPILALQEKYPEILIIPGFEWTTIRLHLNFLGIEDFSDEIPGDPTDHQIKEAIKKAKELGAVVQVDHITWTMNQKSLQKGKYVHPTRENLLKWGVDGFEINNSVRWHDPKTLHWVRKLKENNQLPRPIFLSAGTDIHNPIKEQVTGWTEILLTKKEKENPNWDSIKKALLEGRTRLWADHDYYITHEKKQLKLLRSSKRKKNLG